MEPFQKVPPAAEKVAEAAALAERDTCCMCGDVGIAEHLLQCPVCQSRVQHTYCSSLYPDIDLRLWQCEWCQHSDKKKVQEGLRDAPATPKELKGGKRTPNGEMTAKKRRRKVMGDAAEADTTDPRRPWKARCELRSPRRRYKLLADVLMC